MGMVPEVCDPMRGRLASDRDPDARSCRVRRIRDDDADAHRAGTRARRPARGRRRPRRRTRRRPDRRRCARVGRDDTTRFPAELPDSIRWVQLHSAGVEHWFDAGVIQRPPTWCGRRRPARSPRPSPSTRSRCCWRGCGRCPSTWPPPRGGSGILRQGRHAARRPRRDHRGRRHRARDDPMLTAVGATVIAVNRSGRPVPGADEVVTADRVDEVFGRVDHVVVAAPATADTRHLVGLRSSRSWGPGRG